MTKPLIYLASPYSDNDESVIGKRFADVCLAAGALLKLGHHIFSPIAHCHPIAVMGGIRGDFDWWEQYDHALIDHCDEVWVLMLDGWRSSKGVTKEIAYAIRTGKPVRWVFPETLEVVDYCPDEAA